MLQVNTLLQGRYLILEQIGRGGMGAVYKATDTRLRSTVALKQTLVAGDPARRAFEREAQLLAGLRHPALPRVSDHFMEGDGQFLVMEFIPGDDLAAMLTTRGGPFPVADVLRWADQLLDALDYLHSQQPPVIHRDIKPQNAKLTDRGEIILLDFGLAKGAAAQMSRMTSTGSIFGYTPHYAPLEQIQGAGTSARSDLYSLAATLHHLLTGNPPPDALTRAAATINEAPDPLVPANAINPTVSPAVTAVLTSALSQKPGQRPDSAAAMRAALRDARRVTGRLVAPGDSASVPTLAEPIAGVGQMVIVAAPESQAHSSLGLGQNPTPVPLSTGTTLTSRMTKLLAPPAGRFGKPWLWAALVAVLALLIGGGLFLARGGASVATPTAGPAAAVVPPTSPPTAAPATSTPGPTLDILKAAAGTQTAMAVQQAALLATARVVLNATDFASTQTAIALTPTVTPPPTAAAPTEAAPVPTEAAPTSAPRPASSPRPAPTQRPANAAPSATTAPTSTPRPTAKAEPGGSVISTGGGSMFRGTANLGQIPPEQGAGGACIEGKVTAADGGLFNSFGVQVDLRGNTRQASTNAATGTYRTCGLAAGEWGISVYSAGGVNIPGPEQIAHQVRVMLTGTPGEIFYINFKALPGLIVPTVPPPPPSSPYDGIWRGTNSGKTTTGDYPPGRFEIEVRNGAIYRISVDGPSCPFETYPNGAKGVPINGNSFAVSGSVYNPITGENASIQVNISGVFASESSAGGHLSAQQNGASCADAGWSARK